MSIEDRIFSVIYGIGGMFAAVPMFLWTLLVLLLLVVTGVGVAKLRWGFLDLLVRAIDRLNDLIGRGVSWFMLFIVLAAFVMVFFRKFVGIGAVWTADMIVWPHGMAFMLAAGYTLVKNEHVRVDIFYAEATPRRRAIVDIVGTLIFLMPWVIAVAWVTIPWALRAWEIQESSLQTGGLPAGYIVKSMIPTFSLLLGIQGLALIGRSVLILVGHTPPPDQDDAPADAHPA